MSTITIPKRAYTALKAVAAMFAIAAVVGFWSTHKTYINALFYKSALEETEQAVQHLETELERVLQEKQRLEQRLNQRRISQLRNGQEAECLATNIYFEARGEGYEGMKAVANVVVNRMQHPQFPNTACGVVYQGVKPDVPYCQFSWACDGVERVVNFSSKAWKDSMQLAAEALAGIRRDITGGALYFHSGTVKPRWATAERFTVQIGGHYFYR